MCGWSTYEARLGVSGSSENDPQRDSTYNHTQSRLLRKLVSSLSYKRVSIANKDQEVAITDVADDFNTKKIFSLPGEELPHGALVLWADSTWLITEVDAHKELYTEGKMRRCNYYLKWIDDNGNLVCRWSVVEDGTKYLIGEKQSDMMAIGDARIAVTIGKDEDTCKLNRGRRFLIDDMDSAEVLAYQITKPNKLYNVYNGKGVFRFILNEVNVTDDDNVELRIADYYNWAPKTDKHIPDNQTNASLEQIVSDAKERQENMSTTIDNRKVWL